MKKIRTFIPSHIITYIVISSNGNCRNGFGSMFIPVPDNNAYAVLDIYHNKSMLNKRYYISTSELYRILGTNKLETVSTDYVTNTLDGYFRKENTKRDSVFAIEINGFDVTNQIDGYLHCMSLIRSPVFVFYLYSFINYGKVVSYNIDYLKVKYINYDLEEVLL